MKTIQYDDTKHIDESTVTTEDNPNLNNWNFKRQLNENFTIKQIFIFCSKLINLFL